MIHAAQAHLWFSLPGADHRIRPPREVVVKICEDIYTSVLLSFITRSECSSWGETSFNLRNGPHISKSHWWDLCIAMAFLSRQKIVVLITYEKTSFIWEKRKCWDSKPLLWLPSSWEHSLLIMVIRSHSIGPQSCAYLASRLSSIYRFALFIHATRTIRGVLNLDLHFHLHTFPSPMTL